MKNHFFFGYAGNKRQEVKNIYDNYIYKFKNIEYIIEPFCGTSALSYYISLQEPKKYKYILNDNNKYIIELYNIVKNDELFNKLLLKLEELMVIIRSKETIKEQKVEYNKIINIDSLESYIISSKVYCIRVGLYPSDPIRLKSMLKPNYFHYLKTCPIINFIKNENIIFSCLSAIDVYNNYKNNKKAFIFLDPPYLQLCNDFYQDSNINIYEYLFKNDIIKEKSKILLCINDIWINRLLFNKNIKEEYDKKYELSKNTVQHIIITNY